MHKEMKKLIIRLELQGFEVSIRKTGHVIIFKAGAKVTTIAGTPSDHRSWANSLGYLKRAGFRV